MATLITSTAALARAIRDARRAEGMTQAELARRAGVAQPTLSKIERGVVRSGVDTILRLLAVLRLEIVVRPQPAQEPRAPWEDG